MSEMQYLGGKNQLAGAEGGTSLPFPDTRINTHDQQNAENPRSIRSRRTLLGLYFVDRKRTRIP